jgi:CheY-like chemotaxis protein
LKVTNMNFFQVRRARVRPGFGALYPEIAPAVWISARRAAHLLQQRYDREPCQPRSGNRSRVLYDPHFEFRGGLDRRESDAPLCARRLMAAPAQDSAGVVLVVDDEPCVVRLMERALLDAGCAVHGATSAVEALRWLDMLSVPPAAMVTDLQMTPMNGATLAKLVRAQWPDTPVLFMTGFSPPDESGNLPAPLLEKPFYPDRLVDALAHLISSPQASQPW